MSDKAAERVFYAVKAVTEALENAPEMETEGPYLGFIKRNDTHPVMEALAGIDPGATQDGLEPVVEQYLDMIPYLLRREPDPRLAILDLLTSLASISFLGGIHYQRTKGEIHDHPKS